MGKAYRMVPVAALGMAAPATYAQDSVANVSKAVGDSAVSRAELSEAAPALANEPHSVADFGLSGKAPAPPELHDQGDEIETVSHESIAGFMRRSDLMNQTYVLNRMLSSVAIN